MTPHHLNGMLSAISRVVPLNTPDRKTLLTPAFVNPGLVKRGLALRQGVCVNLHVAPFRSFIGENAARNSAGRRLLEGEELFWLIFSLLNVHGRDLPYFTEAAHFEGLSRLIVSTLQELRLNGVSRDQLSELPNADKWADVCTIINLYEEEKKKRQVFDYSDAVTILLDHGFGCEGTFLIDHPLSLLEKRLVTSSGIASIDPEDELGETKYHVSGFRVDTPYQESLQTVRNIMGDVESGNGPIRIGICTDDYNETYHHVSQILDLMGLRDMVHFLKGEPLLSTVPGKFWVYLVEWAENQFSLYRFLRILESPGFNRRTDDHHLFFKAVRCFGKYRQPVLDDSFLEAFTASLDERSHDDDEGVESLPVAVSELALTLAREADAVVRQIACADQLRCLRDYFETRARRRSEADGAAIERIVSVIDSALVELPGSIPLSDLLATVRESLSGQYVAATLPDRNVPVLGTARELVYGEYDALYLLGMSERGTPRPIHQNPLLLDEEKNLLNKTVKGSAFLTREERLLHQEKDFSILRRTARHRLVMSAPLKDLTTGRELLVSRFLLDEWNRYHQSHGDYRLIAQELQNDPRSKNNHVAHDPADTVYPHELAVSVQLQHKSSLPTNLLLADSFPFAPLMQSFRGRRMNSTQFDEYWGIVEPWDEVGVLSASRLRTWMKCPFKYFLQHVLSLRRDEDFDVHSLQWLDPMAAGSFMHEVFRRFFERMKARREKEFDSVEPEDLEVALAEFEDVLSRYRREKPVSSEAHYQQKIHQLKKDIEEFVHRECLDDSRRMYAELAFPAVTKGSKSKSTSPTIEMRKGDVIRVRGSIDRVDRCRDGRFRLIDYKTGKLPRADRKTIFGGGEFIQAGLYSEVIRQIDPSIIDPLFTFYYVSKQGGFFQHTVDYSGIRTAFLRLLRSIVAEIRAGDFVPGGFSLQEQLCEYCDFFEVCMDRRPWLARKLGAEDPHVGIHAAIAREEVQS